LYKSFTDECFKSDEMISGTALFAESTLGR